MIDRRGFLFRSASAAAAAATASTISTERASGFFAGDTINVACLGAGGRGRWLTERALKIAGLNVVAISDVRADRAGEFNAMMQRETGKSVEVVPDFRTLLDRNDIDAVIIGSPDHWHVPMTIAACEAGKDVYVEKPLTHSIEEGQAVIDSEAKSKRIVQVGTQQRSMPHLIEAKGLVQEGLLGNIFKIKMSWNRNQFRNTNKRPFDERDVDWKAWLGNAPRQPFDAYRLREWRFFWDFGGGILTDLMTHWMDTACWMLDIKAPASAVAMGRSIRYKNWDAPDTIQTLIDFAEDGIQAHFEGTFANHEERAHLMIMGEDASLYCDRGGYRLIPQRHRKVKARERIDGDNPLRGLDFYDNVDGAKYHLQNWSDCMRTRKRPACTAADGVIAALPAHLGNQAFRENAVATLS